MNTHGPVGAKSVELQTEINRLSERLGVRPMPVGFRTKDGLNIYIADDGSYHFTFYERGKFGFDREAASMIFSTGIARVSLRAKRRNGWVIVENVSSTSIGY